MEAEALRTGAYRFVHEALDSLAAEDLAALAARHAGPEAAREVLKVRLSGRIAREERASLDEAARDLRARVLHLDWDETGVRERLDRAAIDAAYPEGSFPHRLLSSLLDDPEALEIAHQALEEARS